LTTVRHEVENKNLKNILHLCCKPIIDPRSLRVETDGNAQLNRGPSWSLDKV